MMDIGTLVLYAFGVVASAVALRWGSKRLGATLVGIAAVAFVPAWIGMWALCPAGSALQGGVDQQGYYLGRHGAKLTQVDRSTYSACFAAEATALLSHAVFVGALVGAWRKRNANGQKAAEERAAADERETPRS